MPTVPLHLGSGRDGRGLSSSSLLVGGLALGGVGLLIGLVRAVNSNLDSNLTALNLLAVHLADSLLLQRLSSQRDETKATALASLTTSLQLLDHEAGDGAQSNLGRGGLVGLEELDKLEKTE